MTTALCQRALGIPALAVITAVLGSGCAGQESGAAPEQVRTEPLRIATVSNVVVEALLTDLRDPRGIDRIGTAEFFSLATPDALRTAITSGNVDVAVMPSTAAANLSRREVDVRLLGVVDYPLMSILGAADEPPGWEGLRGRTVGIVFRGDVTDVLVRMLAESNGLVPDETVRFAYYPQLPPLVADLVSGRSEAAVLPDVAAAQVLAATSGRVTTLVDLSEQWRALTGHVLPLVSLVVRGEVADRDPKLVAALQDYLRDAAATVRQDPGAVVDKVATTVQSQPAVVRSVLDRAQPQFRTGRQAKADLEELYRRLLDRSPEQLNGGLPDDRFFG